MNQIGMQGVSIPLGVWTIDRAHSSISFRVSDAAGTVATIRGRFRDFAGTLEVGEASARAEGVVRVASLTTDDDERDADLLSDAFFNAAAYPEIRFESKTVRIDGNAVTIDGELAMQGSTRELDLTMQVRRVGKDHKGRIRVSLDGRSEIDFADSDVEIFVELSLLPAD